MQNHVSHDSAITNTRDSLPAIPARSLRSDFTASLGNGGFPKSASHSAVPESKFADTAGPSDSPTRPVAAVGHRVG